MVLKVVEPVPPSDPTRTVPFEPAEVAGRLAQVRQAASAAELDLLVVTDPKNLFYLTGYDAYSFYVPQALLVPVDGDEPVLVLRAMDVRGALVSTWLREEQVVGYPESCINDYPHGVHPFAEVAATIAARGWRGRIGVELDGTLTPWELEVLRAALPSSSFAPSDGIVEWVRAVKTPAEVATIVEAAAISDHAMEVAQRVIAPGVREADAAAEIYGALVRGEGDLTGSTPAQPYLSAGERTTNPHLRWGEGAFVRGGPVYVELGGHRHNYAAGLSRTVHLGAPDPAYRRVEGVVTEGMDAAVDALTVGARAEDVEAAWRKVVEPHGITKAARIGYSIGISFPKTIWMEGTISLAAGDRTVLVDGHVLHLMVAVWLGEVGYALSETVHLTDAGPRLLSRVPRDLTVVP